MALFEAPKGSPQGCNFPAVLAHHISHKTGRLADRAFPQRVANRTERAQVQMERANFLDTWEATKETMSHAAEEDLFSPPGEYCSISVDPSTHTVVLTEYIQKVQGEGVSVSLSRSEYPLGEEEGNPLTPLITKYQDEMKPLVRLEIVGQLTEALHKEQSKRKFIGRDEIVELPGGCVKVRNFSPGFDSVKAQVSLKAQGDGVSHIEIGNSNDFGTATTFLKGITEEVVHPVIDVTGGALIRPIPQDTIQDIVQKEQEHRTRYSLLEGQLKAARIARNKTLIEALGTQFIKKYLIPFMYDFRNINFNQVLPDNGDLSGALMRLLLDIRNPLDYSHLEAIQREIEGHIVTSADYLQHAIDHNYPSWEKERAERGLAYLRELRAELEREIPEVQARLRSMDPATLTQPEKKINDMCQEAEQKSRELGYASYGSYTQKWLDRMVKESPAREQVAPAVVE